MCTIIAVYYYELRFISRFSAFIPVTGLKCSYGKIFSQFTGISVGKTETLGNRVSPLSHNYEHIEIFTKDLEALRVLGNRASLVNRVLAKRPLQYMNTTDKPPRCKTSSVLRRHVRLLLETFSFRKTANRHSLQLRVCSFALQILARRSVQFSSFLFMQNIMQYKNTYSNCTGARETRRNQKRNNLK